MVNCKFSLGDSSSKNDPLVAGCLRVTFPAVHEQVVYVVEAGQIVGVPNGQVVCWLRNIHHVDTQARRGRRGCGRAVNDSLSLMRVLLDTLFSLLLASSVAVRSKPPASVL